MPEALWALATPGTSDDHGCPVRRARTASFRCWRKRLGYDGPLLSALTRLFVKTVLEFYRERGGGAVPGHCGAVVAVQRTSSDLKLNPHVHAVLLDGVFRNEEEDGDELEFRALSHLSTRDVAEVLERTRDRMTKYLRRRGLLDDGDGDGAEEWDASERGGLTRLAASAVSGAMPPAGPEWRRGALPLRHRAMVFERPLCVALDGLTLHAATRAGGIDEAGREALLKYILRPAVAQERVTRGPDGLVRIALKRAFGRDRGRRRRPALAAEPPLRVGAASALPHGAVRGGARLGEQASVSSRAEAGDHAAE